MMIGLAISCGGGTETRNNASYVDSQIEVGSEYASYKQGITDALVDQKLIIRDADDFNYYYRLLTGDKTTLGASVLAFNDVLLVVHTVTDTSRLFTISRVSTIDNTLNVYYYYDGGTVGKKYYSFYTLPQTNNIFNYVQIVK